MNCGEAPIGMSRSDQPLSGVDPRAQTSLWLEYSEGYRGYDRSQGSKRPGPAPVNFEDVARVVRLVSGRSDGFGDFEGDYGFRETYIEAEHNT